MGLRSSIGGGPDAGPPCRPDASERIVAQGLTSRCARRKVAEPQDRYADDPTAARGLDAARAVVKATFRRLLSQP